MPAGLAPESEASAHLSPHPGWTFSTDHARVPVCLAWGAESTARTLAVEVGATERAL
ncbi:hypothetical protein [Rhodococcus ruber]